VLKKNNEEFDFPIFFRKGGFFYQMAALLFNYEKNNSFFFCYKTYILLLKCNAKMFVPNFLHLHICFKKGGKSKGF